MRKHNYIRILRAFGVIGLVLILLGLLGCRTRKVSTTEQKQVQKERIIKYKDSTALFQQNTQTLQLDTHALQEYEVTVESDKDSVGNSKELTYTRIRDGDNETIRVRGGKVKITTKSSLSNSLIVANTTLTSTISTTNNELQTTESTTAFSHKTKDVKSSYLYLITIIIVLLVVFYFIRDKLKRFLK
nr:MAG TPA: hypothetical protein [Caudoviricetes sp.]